MNANTFWDRSKQSCAIMLHLSEARAHLRSGRAAFRWHFPAVFFFLPPLARAPALALTCRYQHGVVALEFGDVLVSSEDLGLVQRPEAAHHPHAALRRVHHDCGSADAPLWNSKRRKKGGEKKTCAVWFTNNSPVLFDAGVTSFFPVDSNTSRVFRC